MMMRISFLIVWCFSALVSIAQAPPVYNSADILLRMERLKVLGSVLYIAAHPDDENTRLLAWLARDRHYRTGYLSLTRGDGGQNLIGEEQGIALGMIRTQELLAARRIDGAEQFFTRAYDFGFSKNTEEALKVWDRDKILGDVVWVIRNFQPDVIITRFPPDARAGHGHHSGSSVLAREAFEAAGDPNRYPEHFKLGVGPWQAKRILWNTYNFGSNNTISADQFRVDVGSYNPLVGRSYGEIAAESRSQHKSQGFGVPSARGTSYEFFSHTAGAPLKDSLMDEVNVTWARVEGSAGIEQMVDAIISSYSVREPWRSVKSLVDLYRKVEALPVGYWRTRKLGEIRELILACSAIYLEASSPQPYAVAGDSLRVNFSVINRGNTMMKWNNVKLEGKDTTLALVMAVNKLVSFARSMAVDEQKPISQPYWLRNPMEKGSFNVEDPTYIGMPENPPAYTAEFSIEVEGLAMNLAVPVMYKHTDPVKGELFQPLPVVPPLTVNTSPAIMLFRKNEPVVKNYDVTATAFTDIKPAKAIIHNRGFKSEEDIKDLDLSLRKGATRNFPMPYTNKDMKNTDVDQVSARIEYKNEELDQANYLALASINYDHIPPLKYFYQDGITVLNLDIRTAGKNAGYIKGAGDRVPEALEQLGYTVTYLDERDMNGSLARFDVIVLGVRAYNVHEWLPSAYENLMNYVKNGGVMVVQYNTNSFVGPIRTGRIGPFDFSITNGRVTDEESTVVFNKPGNPLLNWPNKITDLDFRGWVQERGIYFADKWAGEYEAVLGMRDPGEQEDRLGSLLMAKYGKGRFIYTGLAFFRQLPGGVGGAYRLFANIVANPNYKGK
jgi:LmbE family N-acetylglucosaminyl deacetylase